MKRLTRLAAVLAAAAAIPAFAQPIPIVGLVELSGTGATAGTNFDNGVKLAVKEINAAGGLLGRKIEYASMDTQSQPNVAKGLAQKAVDQNAYVVMGPVFSGSIIVSMAETKRAEIPNFTGGEAASITQQGNPYIFRTSFTQSTAMPKVAKYIKDTHQGEERRDDLGQQRLRQGRPRRDAEGARRRRRQGRRRRLDRSGPGRLLRRRAEGQAVERRRACSSTRTRRSRRARCASCKKQGYDKPIIGETTLTGQKVIELAGDAANGALAHVGLTVDAPQQTIKDFDRKFQAEYKYKSDHNGMKGYSGMYVVKAITEKNKKFDGKEFAKALHGAKISAKDYPGVLLDVTFDNNGDLDRESFLVKVENGKQVVTATLPPASAK